MIVFYFLVYSCYCCCCCYSMRLLWKLILLQQLLSVLQQQQQQFRLQAFHIPSYYYYYYTNNSNNNKNHHHHRQHKQQQQLPSRVSSITLLQQSVGSNRNDVNNYYCNSNDVNDDNDIRDDTIIKNNNSNDNNDNYNTNNNIQLNPFQYDASTVRRNSWMTTDRSRNTIFSNSNNDDSTVTKPTATTTTPTTTTPTTTTNGKATIIKNQNSNNNNSNNNSNIISLRSIQMKEIMNELLNAYNTKCTQEENEIQLLNILQFHSQFLLEPLNDDTAVQDIDSIYIHCTNRNERYNTFQETMKLRIEQQTKNPIVQHILTIYRDYIMSHYNNKNDDKTT